jgi:hypothetical protein
MFAVQAALQYVLYTDQCPRGSSQQQNAHANLCEQLHSLELLCCLMS